MGLGRGSQSWEVKQLPDPEQVDWSAIHDVPTVMVTGTNGKSSSIRILAQLVKSAGFTRFEVLEIKSLTTLFYSIGH